MAKPSSSSATPSLILESPTIQIKDMSEDDLRETIQMINGLSGSGQIPDDCNTKGFYSDICRGHLRQLRLEPGRLTYLISVKPAISNIYGSLHGGFVAAAAEFLSFACARTVVAEDKELFLGELSISYLSGAPRNNLYGSLHGGFVAAAAEFLSIACARTVVAEDKDIFLGELSISYLSGAPQNAEVVIDASVIRSGRNLTIVAVEFKLQETGKLVYTARSTFYNTPTAKL